MVVAKLIRLCLCVVKNILKVAAVVILCLVILSLIPNLPPYIEYNAYNVTPPVPLKGALSINTLLNNPERLHEGALKGPEAFDVYNGVLYTGLHGGEIVKFVDGNIIPVTKFGQACEGFWEEKKCGRPLGIKFGRDGFLYVADAYYGLFKVNMNDGTKIQLVSVNDLIEDKPVKLPNGVDIAEDGTVYWTTSSSDFYLEDGVFDSLADGSGRLLRYDPKRKTNEVLIDNLHFANGVLLSSNEEFVLVAETIRSRIHRYYLKGPKKGVHDIFLDGIPGLPDNLKSDGSGGLFIPLILARDSSNPVIVQSLGPFPSIRRAFSRFLALLELLFGQIDSVYPNYYAKRAIHFIGHFESIHGIGPKRITVLHVDENGKIKSSYHSTDGKLVGISEVHWFNGAFYLGSPYNTYVGRVVIDIPELHSHKKLPVKEDPVLKKQAQDQGQPKKQTKQEQEKRPITEQKPPESAVQQKHSAQGKKSTSSDVHQQKQSIKEEKVPVKQHKQEIKEQSKPVPQPKQPLENDKPTVQQQKAQPKVQNQTPQQKSGKEEKPSMQQQKPHLQQSKETVNEGTQSAGQQKQKPQPATPKPPVQQQKQQSAEVPKPAAQQRPAEVPKSATPQQKQQQRPTEVPKSATPQQKQQQRQAEVPKSATPQQKQQQRPTDVPKSATPQQKQQQRQAEIPKSATHQQKQATEVPKPAAQQQATKPAAEQQRQQQRSAEVPKSAAPQQKQQQKLEVPDKKVEIKQEKQRNEQKTVPHQKPQVKETKPQVQQQRNPVKQETIPAQQKEQAAKHKPVVQQQKSQPQEDKSQKQQQKPLTKEEQPVIQQQKKTAEQHKDQKTANQQEPVKPISQGQGKKPIHQENSSPQQGQPSEASHQKPKVQDKTPTKEQHPPK